MATRRRAWAVVLAAGDGTRLAQLTRDARGHAVPKQYCSLNGGASLLQEAMHCARRLAPRERLWVVFAPFMRGPAFVDLSTNARAAADSKRA